MGNSDANGSSRLRARNDERDRPILVLIHLVLPSQKTVCGALEERPFSREFLKIGNLAFGLLVGRFESGRRTVDKLREFAAASECQLKRLGAVKRGGGRTQRHYVIPSGVNEPPVENFDNWAGTAQPKVC